MKTSKWTLLIVAPLVALACAQKVEVTADPPPPERVSGESDLQTVTTGQALTVNHWNSQKFLTRSKVAAFRAVYKFNSGKNRSLQIFRMLTSMSCAGQVGAQTLTLQSEWDDDATIIQEREPVALIPDTEYEFTYNRALDCSEAQMSLQFLAWLGTSSQTTPDVGRICQEAQGSSMTFFTGGAPSAYLDQTHAYIDDSLYCGQNSGTPARQCMSVSSNGQEETHCYSGQNANDGFAFKMTYDAGLQQIRLQCSLNGAVFAQKALQSCRELILDSALYH